MSRAAIDDCSSSPRMIRRPGESSSLMRVLTSLIMAFSLPAELYRGVEPRGKNKSGRKQE
jgi:hypothetical protein